MATKKAKAVKSGDERKKEILDCAAQLVGQHGAVNVTRRMVAQKCKVSESLVAHYFGSTADAQKKYKAHAKKLGIAEPSKEKIADIGAKLRAHGPRAKKVVRKKTGPRKAVTKVVLPKPPKPAKVAKKVAKVVKKVAAKKSARSSTPAKKSSATAATAPKRKSAARAPKLPPPLPPLPPVVIASDGAPLPPLPTFN